ncbi:MAG: carbohydrate kinase family protein, partial [Chloroflexota bacterium]
IRKGKASAHDWSIRLSTAEISVWRRFGNLLVDLVLGPLARFPAFGQEVVVAERAIRSAGQAFTTAVALAALGDAPNLISAVGDDDLGARILADLRAGAVATDLITVEASRPTGLTVALLNTHRDRAFVTHLGHLDAFCANTVFAHWADIAGSRYLLFCGYGNLPAMQPSGGMLILDWAKAEGLITVLDTGWDPDNWQLGAREEVWEMLRATDIFLPNLEEARALTGLDDTAQAAHQLASAGPGTVIIKLGPEGAIGYRDGKLIHAQAVPTIVKDTVGAGDAFNAGILFALTRDWSLADALSLGTAVAGYTITGHEARHPTITQALAWQRRVGND